MFLVNRRGQDLPSSFSLYGGGIKRRGLFIGGGLSLKENTHFSIILAQEGLRGGFT